MNKPIYQAIQIMILGLAILAMAAIVTYLIPQIEGYGGLAVLVCLFGAIGGVGNNFRRLQQLQLHNWEELDSTTRSLMTLQIYLSPIIGALFAAILYIVFMTGFVKGVMFPEFDTTGQYSSLIDFASSTPPATNADVAKLILWSFIAGFAENFVPNFIDKLADDASQSDNA